MEVLDSYGTINSAILKGSQPWSITREQPLLPRQPLTYVLKPHMLELSADTQLPQESNLGSWAARHRSSGVIQIWVRVFIFVN